MKLVVIILDAFNEVSELCIARPSESLSESSNSGGLAMWPMGHVLFLYMYGLSEMLNTCQTGCYSGVSKVNHLMYADDLVLLSPSNIGLGRLLL